MSSPLDALVIDLLEWIGPGGRPYAEVIDAWRTSCLACPSGRRRTRAALLFKTGALE